MKIWMWQRLWKCNIRDGVYAQYAYTENDVLLRIHPSKYTKTVFKWHWLCPRPNLVLVDRKHLGRGD